MEKFLNYTGLAYFFNRIKTIFASKDELDALDAKVDDIIAEGGEPNKIETVKVNGTALTPDANKAVNVEVPRDYAKIDSGNLSGQAYDGSGNPAGNWSMTGSTNGYTVSWQPRGASEPTTKELVDKNYVDTNAGKIDKIKVNGTEQTITNKEVDLNVPTVAATETAQAKMLGILDEQSKDGIDITDATYGIDVAVKKNNTALFSKQLASKDYVDTEAGTIRKIKVNGTEQTITNKEVDISVPTKVSELNNDSNFIDNTVNNLLNYYKKTETYTQAEVDALLAAIESGRFVKADELPTASASTMHKIYLIPKPGTPASTNIRDEFITIEIDNAGTKTYEWEQIGDTAVDLDGYWNEDNLVAITTAEIDALFV